MNPIRTIAIRVLPVAFVLLALLNLPFGITAATKQTRGAGAKRVRRCKMVTVNGVRKKRCRMVVVRARRSATSLATTAAPPPPDTFPTIGTKPTPQFDSTWPCQPQGDATPTSNGDIDLNRLKNRVDEGDFKATTINSILALEKPVGVCNKNRSKWNPTQTDAIQQFEGTPIVIEGFLALVKNGSALQGGRKEGQESCNCHGDEDQFRDFHIWVLPEKNANRGTSSVVVEMTPPVRSKHPTWTIKSLSEIAKGGRRIRVSGWLLFDQEHCSEVGKSRGTVWELHPVIKFEQFIDGQWKEL
ncbi:MAG: hypothetical protein JST84_10800 [Acidobacteria bacterium]|nr:hypothetical protein [Acidobacteriota bacterium]